VFYFYKFSGGLVWRIVDCWIAHTGSQLVLGFHKINPPNRGVDYIRSAIPIPNNGGGAVTVAITQPFACDCGSKIYRYTPRLQVHEYHDTR
jgi:hypothetical protein